MLQFPTHNCLCIASGRKIHFRYVTNTIQIHYKFITNKLQIHYIIALLIVWNRNCVRFAGGKATNVGKSPIVPPHSRRHQKHQQNQQESIWLKQRCIWTNCWHWWVIKYLLKKGPVTQIHIHFVSRKALKYVFVCSCICVIV